MRLQSLSTHGAEVDEGDAGLLQYCSVAISECNVMVHSKPYSNFRQAFQSYLLWKSKSIGWSQRKLRQARRP